MWRHRGVCVEANLSHEGLMAIGYTDLHLDITSLDLSGSTKISKGKLGWLLQTIPSLQY
jgi:hypothetical protein